MEVTAPFREPSRQSGIAGNRVTLPDMLLLTVCLLVLLYCGVEGQDQVRQADPGHHHLLHPQLQSLHCGPALIPVLTGRKVSSLKYTSLLSLVSPWSEVSRFGPLELNIFLSCGNKIQSEANICWFFRFKQKVGSQLEPLFWLMTLNSLVNPVIYLAFNKGTLCSQRRNNNSSSGPRHQICQI